MKWMKFSLIGLLSLLFVGGFAPQLSAGHHHKYKVKKYKSRSTAFALSLNLGAPPVRYVEYVPVYPAPSERIVIAAQPTVVEQRVVYYPVQAPACGQQIVVQRPAQTIYVAPQPQYTY